MKIWVIKKKNKKRGNFYVVRAYDEITGRTKALASFDYHKQAHAFANEQKLEQPENLIPAKIEYKESFKKYVQKVLNNELIVEETRLNKAGAINNHIRPAFDAIYKLKNDNLLSSFKYLDFDGAEVNFVQLILNSKCTAVRNRKASEGGGSITIRTEKNLGKKAIKDVIQEFKQYVKFCHNNSWKMPHKILDFKFPQTFFQGYETEEQWVPTKKQVDKLINSEKDFVNKVMWFLGAETGARPNEILGLCYEDIDLLSEIPTIFFRHTTDKWNIFRPNTLKTLSSRRKIKISNKLAEMLKTWMVQQAFPRKEKGWTMLFGRISKAMSKKRIKAAAKKLGIDWVGGLKPWRKYSYSLEREQNKIPEVVSKARRGWTMNSRTPGRYYHKDLNNDPKAEHDAINEQANELLH